MTRFRLHYLLCVLALVGGSSRARALDKAACVQASETGQELRLNGKLVDARARFAECREVSCPRMVRDACAEWFTQVDRDVPTVVLSAREPSGAEPVGVALYLDDVARALDGQPIALDPGPHTFRVTAADGRAAMQRFVAVSGDHGRNLSVVLPSPPSKRGLPWPAIATGVGSAVAWGAFAGFGLAGVARYDALQSSCAPRCVVGSYAPVNGWFVAADVSLGLAIVGTVTTVALLVLPRITKSTTAASSPRLQF